MTTYGKLYDYAFEMHKSSWDWVGVDKALFDVVSPPKFIKNCLQMIQDQFELPLNNVWRVHMLDNGLVELNDFTMPSNTGKLRESFKQEELPQWIQDSLSVLMIVDQGITVEGVGKKITDSIFYLMETPDLEGIYGNKA